MTVVSGEAFIISGDILVMRSGGSYILFYSLIVDARSDDCMIVIPIDANTTNGSTVDVHTIDYPNLWQDCNLSFTRPVRPGKMIKAHRLPYGDATLAKCSPSYIQNISELEGVDADVMEELCQEYAHCSFIVYKLTRGRHEYHMPGIKFDAVNNEALVISPSDCSYTVYTYNCELRCQFQNKASEQVSGRVYMDSDFVFRGSRPRLDLDLCGVSHDADAIFRKYLVKGINFYGIAYKSETTREEQYEFIGREQSSPMV